MNPQLGCLTKLAEREADLAGDDEARPEHLLLAMIWDKATVTRRVLEELGAVEHARAELISRIADDSYVPDPASMQDLFRHAVRAVTARGADVVTEPDVLLAMTEMPATVAHDVLEEVGAVAVAAAGATEMLRFFDAA